MSNFHNYVTKMRPTSNVLQISCSHNNFRSKKNKRLLVAYTRAAVISSVQQANHEIAEQINQGQPRHTQS